MAFVVGENQSSAPIMTDKAEVLRISELIEHTLSTLFHLSLTFSLMLTNPLYTKDFCVLGEVVMNSV